MSYIKQMLGRIISTNGMNIPDYIWNLLEIRNPNASTLNVYYDFILENTNVLEGDIVEFGVYRGASLVTTALLLKSFGSDKKVYGFDTFKGFPPMHANDNKERFKELYKAGEITKEHYELVLFKMETEQIWPREHMFDKTSLNHLKEKIERFELNNVIIVEGDITDNLHRLEDKIMAVLYDCDLYAPYADTLPKVFDLTVSGGLLYFDEYYSLKYPGPRIAVNAFCQERGLLPQKSLRHSKGSFERWYLQK